MSVKRWTIKWDETEVPDGEYVGAYDYDAMKSERDQAVALLRRFVDAAEGMKPVPPVIVQARLFLRKLFGRGRVGPCLQPQWLWLQISTWKVTGFDSQWGLHLHAIARNRVPVTVMHWRVRVTS